MDQRILLLFVLLGITTGVWGLSAEEILREEWEAFKAEHKKTYEHELEEQKRMNIFLEHKTKVAQHNQKYHQGEVSYKLALNKYADLSHEEFVHTLNGFKQSLGRRELNRIAKNEGVPFTREHVKLPKHVDWRRKQAVTPVKDQGHCGSCWAFSSTGSLEGAHKIKTGVLVSLSEQNLIDCSTAYGNNGCNGGLMDNAFKYIRDNKGLDTEKSYPYLAVDSDCQFNETTVGATDRGFVDVPEGDEDALQEAIAKKGPVSVAIDASKHSFMLYGGGIYNEPNCSTEALDHGVLAVGYGTEETGEEYWLVKNSWGITWGEDGYIKMARNLDNQCGIATQASFPLV